MSSPGYSENKRFSIPVSPSSNIRESSQEPRSRSNSVAKRDSIDVLARDFAENSEKLASRHQTSKVEVVIRGLIKVLEAFISK